MAFQPWVLKNCDPVPHEFLGTIEYFSEIHPHVSKYASATIDAAKAAQHDWKAPNKQLGSESHLGTWVALSLPATLQERVFCLAYPNEAAVFEEDGNRSLELLEVVNDTDSLPTEVEDDQKIEATSSVFDAAISLESGFSKEPSLWKNQLYARIAVQILDVDKKHGQATIDAYAAWSKNGSNRKFDFPNIEQYLRQRIPDVMVDYCMYQACFGADLEISETERNSIMPIYMFAYAHIALTNDYYSWGKELKQYVDHGNKKKLLNAVYILVKQHDIDIDEAKKLLKEEIVGQEKAYLEAKEQFIAQKSPSPAILGFFELLDLLVAGNMLWSAICPRYCDPRELLPVDDTRSSAELTALVKAAQFTDTKYSGPSGHLETQNASLDNAAKFNNVLSDRQLAPSVSQEELILAPFMYIETLKGKGTRDAVLDALQVWYQVPNHTLESIKKIIENFHNCSLMVDDIQDNSLLRRGSPAAHTIYGSAQTVNSAYLAMLKTIQTGQNLSDIAVRIILDELCNLHGGQGFELHFSFRNEAPTQEQYNAICQKTSSLFTMAARLMQAFATANKELSAKRLTNALGLFFQVRDDYKNLKCSNYADKKGSCDDLNEGKFSFLIIHALSTSSNFRKQQLQSLLQLAKSAGGMGQSHKDLALSILQEAGSFDYTEGAITCLLDRVYNEVHSIENITGEKNWILRLLLHRLDS